MTKTKVWTYQLTAAEASISDSDAVNITLPKMVSFRIRRRYYDQIVSGKKKEELRAPTEYWMNRLIPEKGDPPRVAVFVCGKDVHRRKITKIRLEIPEKVLGRPLSEQGIQDLHREGFREGVDPCIVIELGEVYKRGENE